jgi:alpha-tubulin suppressor-like RCC1 family protein
MSLNTNLGTGALANNSTGSNNVAVGGYALTDNTSGNNNAAIGANSQLFNTTGSNNVSVGPAALMSINGANDNTAIGANAMEFNANGVNNVAVGSRAGYIATSGNYNTFLGAHADVVSNNYFEYSTAIGYGSKITADHQIVLGTSDENVIVLTNPLNYTANSVVPKSYVDSFAGGATGPPGPPGGEGPQGPFGNTGFPGPQGIRGQTGSPGINGINGEEGAPGPRGITGAKGANGGLIGYMNYAEYTNGYLGVTYSQIAFSQASNLSGATAVYVTNGGASQLIQQFLSPTPLPTDVLEGGIYTPNLWISTAGTTGMVLSTSLSLYNIATGGSTLIADSSPIEVSSVKLTNYNQSTGTGSAYSGVTGLHLKFDIYCDSSISGSGETFYISYQNNTYYSLLSTTVATQGPPGSPGDIGPQGYTGLRGFQGDIGPPGQDGPPGLDGSQGDQGPRGNTGIRGNPGTNGSTGLQGPRGDQGVVGPTGPPGSTGPAGSQGERGEQGPRGATGVAGSGTILNPGNMYSDYLYWNNTAWVPGSNSGGRIGTVHIGPDAGLSTQTNYSVAIGANAGRSNQGRGGTTGGSIAIGAQAGYNAQGINSVAIGPNAGYTLQGNYSVAIGRNAQSGHDNSIAIGQNATTTAVNQMMLGTTGTSVVANGSLNVVGNATVNGTLNVLGNATGLTPPSGDSSTKFATTEWVANNATSSSKPVISRITRSGVNSMLFSSGNQLYECHGKYGDTPNYTSGRSAQTYNAALIGNYGFERAAQLYFPFGSTSPRNLVDFNTTSEVAYALFKSDGYTAGSGGDLYTWGGNGFGQCGQGTTVYVGTPTLVTGLTGAGITNAVGNIVEVYCNAESINGSDLDNSSLKTNSRLFIRCRQDNLIYGCGWNLEGALGLGNTTNQSTLTGITGSSGYKNVWNMGADVGCLVCQDAPGNVLTCGYGAQGCLGRGDLISKSTLGSVLNNWSNDSNPISPTRNIVTVCGGFGYYSSDGHFTTSFMSILFSDGSIFLAGNNTFGSIGNNLAISGNITSTPTKLVIPSGATGATGPIRMMKSNNTGPGAMYALYENDNLYSWGYNGVGQLGITGSGTTSSAQVRLVKSDIKRIFSTSSSYYFPYRSNLFAITGDNKLLSCGFNNQGECGQGVAAVFAVSALAETLIPSNVVSNIKDIGYYAPGNQSSDTNEQKGRSSIFLVTNNNTVYSWGSNSTSSISAALDQVDIFSPIPMRFTSG